MGLGVDPPTAGSHGGLGQTPASR